MLATTIMTLLQANDDVKKTVEQLDGISDTSLALTEAVATIYEDNLRRNKNIDEVLATIYETILGGQAWLIYM